MKALRTSIRVNELCHGLGIPVEFSTLDDPLQTFEKLMIVEEQILLHEKLRRETSRKYSISEIDEMRENIRLSYGPGMYFRNERADEIERRLRTYLENKVSPDEVRQYRTSQEERWIKHHD